MMDPASQAILSALDRRGDLAAAELLREAARESGKNRTELRLALRDLASRARLGFVERNGRTMVSLFAGNGYPAAEGIALCPEGSDLPGFDGIVIKLCDGPAFGNGEHPTTRLCLSALSRLLGPGGELPGELREKAFDAGCGTGVLAVAAALLGVRRVLAADLDPWAVFAAGKNASANGVAGRVAVSAADAEEAAASSGPFGLVLANLRVPTLTRMLPSFRDSLSPGGRLVCSGMTEEEAPDLVRKAEKAGLCRLFGGTRGRWAMEAFAGPDAGLAKAG